MAKKGDIKRYPLNMRTTKAIREKLERATAISGRSLAQEVERRLELSFLGERTALAISRGYASAPVLVHNGDLLLNLFGDDIEGQVLVLKISPDDLERFLEYFRETQP